MLDKNPRLHLGHKKTKDQRGDQRIIRTRGLPTLEKRRAKNLKKTLQEIQKKDGTEGTGRR